MSAERTLITNENYINLIHEVNDLKNDICAIKDELNSRIQSSFVCYEGKYYDGLVFVRSLISTANNRVIIIDGYADKSVLDFFIDSKRDVKKCVVCYKASRIDEKSLQSFNKQYGEITIKEDKSYHDRFLIIDNDIYLLGTSLNSLGNKTSTITKTDKYKVEDIYKN